MSGGIEALYIFDQHNEPILQHTYRSRPPSPNTLLPLYLAHPSPRPSLICLSELSPPTILFSLLHANLLFLSPTSVETEPLLVLEFLHRVTDVLEEFLGTPLLASKIESGYDVVAQLLGEMCDAGAVSNTEPNTLRDVVDVPGWVGKLLGGVGLPGSSTPTPSSGSLSLHKPTLNPPKDIPQLPWRRANVRHTSNELYVDILESLSVMIAPSGRPLSAIANGSIAFTSRISGVPDLLLTLTTPSGKAGVDRAIELPVFHPCVRLARWRSNPGELSFVPPDGRFVLAGYEVDLLPSLSTSSFTPSSPSATASNLPLPVSLEIRTNLGLTGADFEVRLVLLRQHLHTSTSTSTSSTSTGNSRGFPSRLGTSSPALGGSSSSPTIEDVTVYIPIPSSVRNMSDLRASRGEASFSPSDGAVEWRIPSRDSSTGTSNASATLRCTVVGAAPDRSNDIGTDDDATVQENDSYQYTAETSRATPNTNTTASSTYPYTDDTGDSTFTGNQSSSVAPPSTKSGVTLRQNPQPRQRPRDDPTTSPNAALMPDSATVSFSVKGWLASGIRVESLVVNTRQSRGLGEGVRPYKGVKYLTVSRKGVEVRC
ncbi:MAG: hypothetical protein M1837_000016 [Sclerophora amabilis]|nr:MAG: hypothetical protein M1837_000016 [Sclerophora amabilis]